MLIIGPCPDCGILGATLHCLPCLRRAGICVSHPDHPDHAAFTRSMEHRIAGLLPAPVTTYPN